MRVGLIIYGSINTTTGGYIYDYKLIEYLRSQGVVVKIFSQRKKNFFDLIRNNWSKKIISDIIEFSPDVLLQDEMNFSSLFFLNKKLKKIGNFPIISIVHLLQANAIHHFLRKWLIKKVEKRYLKTVNGFIFNSISTKQSITKINGKNSNFLIAYPGKDRLQLEILEQHITFKCQDNKFMIIFIGNLLYNKGLHVLLHALSQIDYSCWHLSIVGGIDFDLKYTRKIFKMIADLELEDNIKIHGVLDVECLKTELLSKHVLVVPSYYESYGIVYTEVMGAGIPVIACNNGGAPEIINHTINGFLINPGDSTMLKEGIIKLIKNRELLKEMSFSSLSAYQTFPSWNDTMAKVYAFLNQNVHGS